LICATRQEDEWLGWAGFNKNGENSCVTAFDGKDLLKFSDCDGFLGQ